MPDIIIAPTTKLQDAATTTNTGSVKYYSGRSAKTVQATVAGTGAVTATVPVYVSNDNVNWLLAGTITLSGTTSATDGFAMNAAWLYYRADVSAITGTGAAVTVLVGL